MILHIVNKSPYSHQILKECLRVCIKQGSILFIEDGVLAATDSPLCQQLIIDHPQLNFYALKADIEARGLTTHEQISIIDDEGFVELVVTHDSVQSWS